MTKKHQRTAAERSQPTGDVRDELNDHDNPGDQRHLSDQDDLDTADFVAFDMRDERYAFPMHRVQEIIRMPKVVRVPLGPSSLEGLANLRGRVLPVVNLRTCCGLPTTEHDETTRVIVVDGATPLGFVVDRVASVVSVARDSVESTESVRATIRSDVLVGVIKPRSGEMTTVLDVDRLISTQFMRLARHDQDLAQQKAATDEESRAEESADILELVSFAVDGQEYALPIDQVQEIVQAPKAVSRIPNAGDRVLGVMNLRGRLLPVLSMRRVFGLPVTSLEPQNRIVVVSLASGIVGVVMDTVREVLRVPRHLVAALPAVVTGSGRASEVESVCRLDDGSRLVSVLTIDRMFDAPGLRTEIEEHHTQSSEAGADTDSEEATVADDGRGDEELFVVFHLDAEEYAVDVDTVQEIIRVPESLIRVPKTLDFVEGLVNLRGTVLPVIDLRTRLGLPRLERDERQRIVVLIIGGVRTGFVVDSVAEVARVPRNVLGPAPELSDELARLVNRVANLPDDHRMLLLVQADQLLGVEQANALTGVATDESVLVAA